MVYLLIYYSKDLQCMEEKIRETLEIYKKYEESS